MTIRVLSSVLIVLAATLLQVKPVSAQDKICGRPPQLSEAIESDINLKSHIQPQAKFLSSLIGKDEFSQQVEVARRKLYETKDSLPAASKDAYLLYTFCVLVLENTALNASEKLKALEGFRASVSLPEEQRQRERIATSTSRAELAEIRAKFPALASEVDARLMMLDQAAAQADARKRIATSTSIAEL